MHIDDTLLHTVGTGVDLDVFLASFPCEPMQAQEVPIISLNNVFLSCVTVELAEFDKIGCVPDGFRHLWRLYVNMYFSGPLFVEWWDPTDLSSSPTLSYRFLAPIC